MTTKENTIHTDSDVRTTASSSIERVAHAYCPRCNPDPQPGQPITALCGVTYPFWGRRDRPISTCEVCHTLASAVVFQCGHLAQSM
jgi:hypothetical protein